MAHRIRHSASVRQGPVVQYLLDPYGADGRTRHWPTPRSHRRDSSKSLLNCPDGQFFVDT